MKALGHLIAEIRETSRIREDYHRTEKSLTNQVKAVTRRLCGGRDTTQSATMSDARSLYNAMMGKGEHRYLATALGHCSGLLEARAQMKARRLHEEKLLRKLARELPIWDWAESVRGLGALGLTLLIGEIGDPGNYPSHRHVWKRMGVAVMDDGQRQRRVKGAEALRHGYSPRRRAILFRIGDAIKKQSAGHYREVYLERKAYERATAEAEGLTVCPASRIPKTDRERYRSLGWIDNRARRYMEKRLLADLWREWGGVSCGVDARVLLASPPLAAKPE